MKLNKIIQEGKVNGIINTGFITYIGYEEKWTEGIYNNTYTEYFVSSLGRIFNVNKNKLGKLFVNESGYIYCQSYYKGKRSSLMLNRLVLESFHGSPEVDIIIPEADHIDRNIKNNSIDNLQWLSRKDNLDRRILSDQNGENNNASKYTNELILKIADDLESGKYGIRDISRKYKIPITSVSNIKNKYRWKKLLKDYNFDNVPTSRTNRKKYTKNQIQQVYSLLNTGASLSNISDITGVSRDTIYYYKKKM